MKKLLILLLSLCMICSIGAFTACNEASSESSSESSSIVETVGDKIRSKARTTVQVGVYVKYGYFPTISITNVRSYTNTYYVSGKYTVRDNYGDNYTGKFDLTIVYNSVTDTCKVTKEEIQTAYKN